MNSYLQSSLCYSQEECDQMTIEQKKNIIINDGRGYLLDDPDFLNS